MSSQVQFRRGTTTQNNAFTGAQGEITYDTDLKTLRLHDGSTAGGGATVVTLAATQSLTNKTLSTGSSWAGSAIGLSYGGTGSSLSAVAGAIAYSGASGLALTSAGSSGQLLQSAGTSSPIWVNASSLTTGTALTATTASNIAGGSAGYLVYQTDTNTSGFIPPGASGTFLKSTGASTAPTWAAGAVTYGSTTVSLGGTSTSIAGLTAIDATSGATSFFATPTSPALFAAGTAITIGDSTGIATVNNSQFVHSSTNYTKIAVGTQDQRPGGISGNPGTAAVGMIRYNSTISSYEGYASGNWSSLGGVKAVNGFTYILAESSAGAANGDLDFYAQNAGVTAAVQIGQWNRTNLKDYTGTLVGTQTTQNIFNTVATTINLGGAATTINFGATSAGAVANFNKNVVISGNLTVQGTTTTSSSASLTVSDSAVYVNTGATGNTKSIGIIGTYISASTTYYTGVLRDHTDSTWKFYSTTTAPTAGTVQSFTGATYDSVRLGTVIYSGSTSGTTTLQASATATGTLTLPATSDTLVGRATTDTLTNKTISAGVLTGTLTAGGGVGTSGQILQSTGTGVQWASATISLAGTSGTGSVSTGGTLTFAGTYGVTATASSSTITIATPTTYD